MEQFTRNWYKEKCRELHLHPEKGRGQNFLCDEHICEKIAEIGGMEGNVVLEVGPGFGVLTKQLVKRAQKVIALDLEEKFCKLLPETLGNPKNLETITANFLEYGVESIESPYRVIANLPYSISSETLFLLVESQNLPESITLLLQKEVVQRASQKPPYGNQLALAMHLYGNPTLALGVSKNSFYPSPKVDSAVLHVKRHHDNHEVAIALKKGDVTIAEVLKVARGPFLSPRKQIGKTLTAIFGDKALSALESAKISKETRPEKISALDWIAITTALNT